MEATGARLVVDGSNVMGSRPDGWWRDREGAAARLVERIARWAHSERRDVLVVFDGSPPDWPAAGGERVEVAYAGSGRRDAADDMIVAGVARAPEMVGEVVTSDAGLAARVRAHGVRVTGAGGFLAALDAV